MSEARLVVDVTHFGALLRAARYPGVRRVDITASKEPRRFDVRVVGSEAAVAAIKGLFMTLKVWR